MERKAIVLQDRGMSRDLSVSKTGNTYAYDNRNIRVLAREDGTSLSVTGERGNREVPLGIEGTLLGWNVLGNHIVLFTHEDPHTDRIYRVDYNGRGSEKEFGTVKLYEGDLLMDAEHPVESVVYGESDDIQKIYWVDGRNVLRFMNFMAKEDVRATWRDDSFDVNRACASPVSVSIARDSSGSSRPNGIAQYLLTYYDRYGRETGIAWMSGPVYLSPEGRGGAADGSNTCRVTLTFSGLDTSFDHFRVYLLMRTSQGQYSAYIVSSQLTSESGVTVTDTGYSLEAVDYRSLLYLGSRPVIAGTLAHKDGTLFLGDLRETGRGGYTGLEEAIHGSMFVLRGEKFVYGTDWQSSCVTFAYSDDSDGGTDSDPALADIPYVTDTGTYPYRNQLECTGGEILSFKGGEKYRFALRLQLGDGTETEAFWIGDAVNPLYPAVDPVKGTIKRIVARCQLPEAVTDWLRGQTDGYGNLKYRSVRLMVAEAGAADRSVKAQGIVNPTMFNTWERYSGRLWSLPTWTSRPRNSSHAWRHFEPVHNASGATGEIQCGWWDEEEYGEPSPLYQYTGYGTKDQKYADSYDGLPDWNCMMVAFRIKRSRKAWPNVTFIVYTVVVKGYSEKADQADDPMYAYAFKDEKFDTKKARNDGWVAGDDGWYVRNKDGFTLKAYRFQYEASAGNLHPVETARLNTWTPTQKKLRELGVPSSKIPTADAAKEWYEKASGSDSHACATSLEIAGSSLFKDSGYYTDLTEALNGGGSLTQARWTMLSDIAGAKTTGGYTPAYYTKQYMFVDENTVTLDSPELSYGQVSLDGGRYGMRIVGAARMTSVIGDYTVNASGSSVPGDPLDKASFIWRRESGHLRGILSWPLWKERSLMVNDDSNDKDEADRDSSDFTRTTGTVHYWLHMWQRAGSITGYSTDDDPEGGYSALDGKVFANERVSYDTVWFRTPYDLGVTAPVRMLQDSSEVYAGLEMASTTVYCTGRPSLTLGAPGEFRYPVLFSSVQQLDTAEDITTGERYMLSQVPVQLQYSAGAHAAVTLGTSIADGKMTQRILPRLFDSEAVSFDDAAGSDTTGALVPWLGKLDSEADELTAYDVEQGAVDGTPGHSAAKAIGEDDEYIYIAEIYAETGDGVADSRYGGISASAVEACRFVNAGPAYSVKDLLSAETPVIWGNEGDTYIQRWDDLRVKPYGTGPNGVIDVVSFLVETHVNIDGRTDLQRGVHELASIDTANYGSLNMIYSSRDDFSVARDIDDDLNTDAYRSSLTWTLQKADLADTDEWTHVTLASSLKLDGDKGVCQAIRRMANSLVAFQDRGISEILFNTRTQMSTTDGVPVELANSGKVDGKRYITNKYGCTDKWSIAEGKAGLYFVDGINRAFCLLGSGGVDNLSHRNGLDAWFRRGTGTGAWTPLDWKAPVAFYDKVHSDVYLVQERGMADEDDNAPALVYSETLGAFMGFFDYSRMPMLANVEDRLVSFRDGSLWLQNEGLYGSFFGEGFGFSVTWRACPEPYGDKVWTNVQYRADFYRVLDEDGNSIVGESGLIDGGDGDYMDMETFDSLSMRDEYQRAQDMWKPVKRFRVWRCQVPRAEKTDGNRFGLDRMRNPWVYFMAAKGWSPLSAGMDLAQIHDVTLEYYV